MFEFNGFVGHPFAFGVFTDYVIPEEMTVDLKDLLEQRKSDKGIQGADEHVEGAKPSFRPVFFITITFTHQETGKQVLAMNDDGVSWGKRLIDNTLIISCEVQDVAETLGTGTWDVNISVDELYAREEIANMDGTITIHNTEPTEGELQELSIWQTIDSKTNKPSLNEWDLSIPKKDSVRVKIDRAQTCVNCEFQAEGYCRAYDLDDTHKWVPVLNMIRFESCPKDYWKE